MNHIDIRRLKDGHIDLAKKIEPAPVMMHLHEYYELELVLSGSIFLARSI
jgi:hypothetical protein